MLRALFLVTVLILGGSKAADPALIGSWGFDGHVFVTFKADGTGSMEDEKFTWASDGKVVKVTSSDGEADQMSYQVKDGQLGLVAGGIPMALTRIGGRSKSAPATET